jgi:tetratricopeptide (TPR) repeat protein
MEAETVLRIAIQQAENSGDSENVGLGLSHLGNLYRLQGRADEARVSLARAIRIWMSNSDEPNPRLIRTAGDLLLIYKDSGDAASAARFWTKTLQPMLSRVDIDTIEFAGLLEQHGLVYLIAKRYGNAEPLLTRAIAIREQKGEPDSEELAIALANRAAMRIVLHRPGDALSDMAKALAILERISEDADPGAAILIGNLGVAYFEKHRFAEADVQFRRALQILAQWPASANEADILKSYAKLLQKSGRKGEARQMELRANAIVQKFAAEPREQRIDVSEFALSPKK